MFGEEIREVIVEIEVHRLLFKQLELFCLVKLLMSYTFFGGLCS